MRKTLKNKKAIAWIVMLTFLFTCIMPSGTALAGQGGPPGFSGGGESEPSTKTITVNVEFDGVTPPTDETLQVTLSSGQNSKTVSVTKSGDIWTGTATVDSNTSSYKDASVNGYSSYSVSVTNSGNIYTVTVSQGTFGHLDIRSAGEFYFLVDNAYYYAEITFLVENDGKYTIDPSAEIYSVANYGAANETKTYVSTVDLSNLKIKVSNKTTGDDIATIQENSSVEKRADGNDLEFTISGTYNRGHDFLFETTFEFTFKGHKFSFDHELTANYYGTENVCNATDDHGRGLDVEISATEITNYFTKGALNIVKSIEGRESSTDTFNFTVYGPTEDTPTYWTVSNGVVTSHNTVAYVTITGEGNLSMSDLPAGTYVITEVIPDGANYFLAENKNQIVVKVAGQQKIAEFENYYNASGLEVVKEVKTASLNGSYTFEVYDADKKLVNTITVSTNALTANSGAYTLPLDPGTYYVKEVAGDGYQIESVKIGTTAATLNNDGMLEVTVPASGVASVTFVNKEAEKVSISVTKEWQDNDNQDGKRPTSIIVRLYADGSEKAQVTLNADNSWNHTFTNLNKYKNGVEIEYTVDEDAVENYTKKPISGDAANGFVITNTLDKSTVKITITGTKTWNDNGDQDGLRPESITVNLLADDKKVDSKTVTADDEWAYSFTGLAKYADGKEIVYTIEEVDVEGYESKVNGYDIVNTHTPETTSVEGKKVWNDNDNQDGKRPAEITVNLLNGTKVVDSKTVTAANNWSYEFEDLPKYADGEEIEYTVAEAAVPEGYESKVNGYNIENTYTPETTSVEGKKVWNDNDNQDGKRPESITVNLMNGTKVVDSKTVTAANKWSYEFKDLPKYADGEEIEYTVAEANVPEGYESKVNGYNIENTHTPETTSVEGKKVWNDNDNQDGKRPVEITVVLYADGVEKDRQTVNGTGNEWTYSFTKLDKYANGKAIVYTVDELAVPNYSKAIDGYTITNTYTPETTNVEGKKVWNDNGDQDGIRPESITVNLLANGEKVDEATVTADANGNWAYEFTNLDKYANGKEIVYTIEEVDVEGYESKVNGYNIVNTHTPETTSVEGKKVWSDNGNQDGKRPAEITVVLYADGVEKDRQTVNGTGNEWTYSFTKLAKYANGKAIVYTVDELAVPNYSKAIDGYTITNTYTPEVTSVSGIKTWVDGNSAKRPAEITVNLLKNGEVVDSKIVEGERTDSTWDYSFTGLAKYENGEEIVYTVEEDPVDGYTTAVDGYNITNTIEQKYFSISGTKTWNVPEGTVLPESITVVLTRNDGEVTEAAVTAADGWKYSFDNLKAYAPDGSMYHYTVVEKAVDGYVASYNVNNDNEANRIVNISNTLIDTTSPTVTISGTKSWNVPEGIVLPESVTINLLQNGTVIATAAAEAANNWKYEFKDLPRFNDENERYVYTVEEVAVDNYLATVVPTANGFDITNTYYVGEAGSFSVTKVVSGGDEMVPADDTAYGFRLKVKATVAEWTALLVHQRNELQAAKTAAEENLANAEVNLTNAENTFRANAKVATTGSAYEYEYQYLMVGDKVETTSGSAYELTGLLNGNAILTTTGSAYAMKQAVDVDDDLDILDRIVNAIKAMVNRIRNFHDDVFIGMLSEEVQGTTPSALMFQKNDVVNLMNAERDVQDANEKANAAAKALDDFLAKEVTTSTAIKVVMTPTAGGDAIELELDAENERFFDKEENVYVIDFTLLKDAGYTVAIEAAEEGTVIEYSISEIDWVTENYVNTEITINGSEKAANARYVGDRALNNGTADTYVFHNIYEANPDEPYVPPTTPDPYTPPYNPPKTPDVPDTPTVPDVPEEPVVIEEPEVPMAEIPGEIIDEEDIPLGDAPPTGDNANAVPFMMMMVLAAAGLAITRRKFS